MPSPHTVVLTGAAGQIGTAIRPALGRLFASVRLVDRVPTLDVRDGETVVTGDLNDAKALDDVLTGADAVIHLAGMKSDAPWSALVHTNVTLVDQLLAAATRAGVTRIALASTMHVMGLYERDERITPGLTPRPDSAYAATKLIAEQLGQWHAMRTGARVSSVRIGCFKEQLDESEPCAWIGSDDLAALFYHVLMHPRGNVPIVHAVVPYRGDDCGQRALRWRHRFRFAHHGPTRAESLKKLQWWYPTDAIARRYRGGEMASKTLRAVAPAATAQTAS